MGKTLTLLRFYFPHLKMNWGIKIGQVEDDPYHLFQLQKSMV